MNQLMILNNLGHCFLKHLAKNSAGLIQGFEVVNGEYAAYNDEWLSYYSVLFKLARTQRPERQPFH